MAGHSARHGARKHRGKAERPKKVADTAAPRADGGGSTAAALSALPSDSWHVLHHRAWPGLPSATLDHVVIGPAGVFVIGTPTWSGNVEVRSGVLRLEGRRRDTAVATAFDAAVAVAETASLPGEVVHGMLCFVRDEPLADRAGGVVVASTASVVELLTSAARVLTPEQVQETFEALSQILVPSDRPAAGSESERKGKDGGRRKVEASEAAPKPRRIRRLIAPVVGTVVTLGVMAALAIVITNFVQQTVVATVPPNSAAIGGKISIDGTPTRPDLRVTAVKVLPPASSRGAAASAKAGAGNASDAKTRLVAVQFVFANAGNQKWRSGTETRVRLVDVDGLTYPSDPAVQQVPGCEVLPGRFTLKAGQDVRGCVAFRVPVKADVIEVRLSVGYGPHDGARWTVASRA